MTEFGGHHVVTKNSREYAMSDPAIRLRLSKKTIDGLSAGARRAIFWDNELPGFGLRTGCVSVKS
jgi:hypothetical protein